LHVFTPVFRRAGRRASLDAFGERGEDLGEARGGFVAGVVVVECQGDDAPGNEGTPDGFPEERGGRRERHDGAA
jgi:hypothetical protein